jgi:hypothetical protein
MAPVGGATEKKKQQVEPPQPPVVETEHQEITPPSKTEAKGPADTFDPLVPPHKDQGQKELSPYEAAKKIHAGFYGAKTDWTAVFQGMQGQSFDQVAEHYEVFNQDFKFDLLHHAPAGPIADAIQHFIDGDQVAMLASRIKANLDANPPNLGDIEGILSTASPELALAVAESFDTQYRNDLPPGPAHPTDFLRESLVNARPGLIGKWDPNRFLSVSKSLEAAKLHETQPLSVKANQAEADGTAASLQANKEKTFELINQLSPEQRLLLSKNEGFKAQIREALGAETPDFHLAMATLYNDKAAITAAKIEKWIGSPANPTKIIETLFNLKPSERLAVSKAFERFKQEPPRVPPQTLEQAISLSIGGDPVIGHLTSGAVNDVVLGAEILHWGLFNEDSANLELLRSQLLDKPKHWIDQVAAEYAEIYNGANLKEDLVSKLAPHEKLELVDQAYDLGKPKNEIEAAQRAQQRLDQMSDIFGNLADKVSQITTNSSPISILEQQIAKADKLAKAGLEADAQKIIKAIEPDLIAFGDQRAEMANLMTDYATIAGGVALGFTGVGLMAVAVMAVAGAVAKPVIDKLVNGNKATWEKLITDAGYGAFLGGTAFLPTKMVGDFFAAIKGQAAVQADELAPILKSGSASSGELTASLPKGAQLPVGSNATKESVTALLDKTPGLKGLTEVERHQLTQTVVGGDSYLSEALRPKLQELLLSKSYQSAAPKEQAQQLKTFLAEARSVAVSAEAAPTTGAAVTPELQRLQTLFDDAPTNHFPSLGPPAPYGPTMAHTDEISFAHEHLHQLGAKVEQWQLDDDLKVIVAKLPNGQVRGGIFETTHGGAVQHFSIQNGKMSPMAPPVQYEARLPNYKWPVTPEVKAWNQRVGLYAKTGDESALGEPIAKSEVPQRYRTRELDGQWYRDPENGTYLHLVPDGNTATSFDIFGMETGQGLIMKGKVHGFDLGKPPGKAVIDVSRVKPESRGPDFLLSAITNHKPPPSIFGQAAAYGPGLFVGDPAMVQAMLKTAGFESDLINGFSKTFADGSYLRLTFETDPSTGLLKPGMIAWRNGAKETHHISFNRGQLTQNLNDATFAQASMPAEFEAKLAGQDLVKGPAVFLKDPAAETMLKDPSKRAQAFKDPWDLAVELRDKGYKIGIDKSGKSTEFTASISNGETKQSVTWSANESGQLVEPGIRLSDKASRSTHGTSIDPSSGKTEVYALINAEILDGPFLPPSKAIPPQTPPVLTAIRDNPALDPGLIKSGKITADLLELDPTSALVELKARGLTPSAFEITDNQITVTENLGSFKRTLQWDLTEGKPTHVSLRTTSSKPGDLYLVDVDLVGQKATLTGTVTQNAPLTVSPELIGARTESILGDYSFLKGSPEQIRAFLKGKDFDISNMESGFIATMSDGKVSQTVRVTIREDGSAAITADISGPQGKTHFTSQSRPGFQSQTDSTLYPPPSKSETPPAPEIGNEGMVAPKSPEPGSEVYRLKNDLNAEFEGYLPFQEGGVPSSQLIKPGELLDSQGNVRSWEDIQTDLTARGWKLKEGDGAKALILERGMKKDYMAVVQDPGKNIHFQVYGPGGAKSHQYTHLDTPQTPLDSPPTNSFTGTVQNLNKPASKIDTKIEAPPKVGSTPPTPPEVTEPKQIFGAWDNLFMDEQPSGFHFPETYRLKDFDEAVRELPVHALAKDIVPSDGVGIFFNPKNGTFIRETEGSIQFYDPQGELLGEAKIVSRDGSDWISMNSAEAPSSWRDLPGRQ